MKCNNIQIIGISEGEENGQGIEMLFEKNDIKLSKLGEEKTMQGQESQRVPIKINPKRPTPRHIIKMPSFKDKERILK